MTRKNLPIHHYSADFIFSDPLESFGLILSQCSAEATRGVGSLATL